MHRHHGENSVQDVEGGKRLIGWKQDFSDTSVSSSCPGRSEARCVRRRLRNEGGYRVAVAFCAVYSGGLCG